MAKLTPADRKTALAQLPGWRFEVGKNAMVKHFKFKDFAEAFDFMTDVADEAEAQDHHPEWTNVYNQVEIRLFTHDAGGLTDKDITLAHAIERVAKPYFQSVL